MRSRRWLLAASVALLSAAVVIACGGSSDDGGPRELAAIPTATLPNPLPEVVIVSGPSPDVEGATYTVQAGDSLSAIADQFGTTVDAIVEANGISDPTALEVGQVLTIPGATAQEEEEVLGSTAEPASTPAPSQEGNVYIVQEGDIPETIAAQFGITPDALMAANGITDPRSLQVGQQLIIPTPAPEG